MTDLGKRTREHIYETAIAELLTGLKPFAEANVNHEIFKDLPDETLVIAHVISSGVQCTHPWPLRHFRRARSLLEKYSPPDNAPIPDWAAGGDGS